MNLSLSLKLLALFFWWYIPNYIFLILSLSGVHVPIVPEFRISQLNGWDFELMFATIFAVWGWYVWRAAQNPTKSLYFIDFTIWATVAHIAAMVAVGFFAQDDSAHMFVDAAALSVPTVLVMYFRFIARAKDA